MDLTGIIAEDEPLLREDLSEQLGKIWPELSIVGKAADGIDALRLLVMHKPDVVFLDIQMPGMTGLEVARQRRALPHRLRHGLRPVRRSLRSSRGRSTTS